MSYLTCLLVFHLRKSDIFPNWANQEHKLMCTVDVFGRSICVVIISLFSTDNDMFHLLLSMAVFGLYFLFPVAPAFLYQCGSCCLCFVIHWTGIRFHNRPRCKANLSGIGFFPSCVSVCDSTINSTLE